MKRPNPQGLYAIVDLGVLRARGDANATTALAVATSLLRGGVRTMQLRAKGAGGAEFLELARALRDVTRALDATFIVNDRIDVALLCGADGVHLGQTDPPPAAARAQLGDDALIGLSTHDAAQVAAAQSSGADYLGYGPVFATASKKNPDPVRGAVSLAAAAASSSLPLTAIGGITLERVAQVRASGAASFAVIADLFRGDEGVEARARAFAAAWRGTR